MNYKKIKKSAIEVKQAKQIEQLQLELERSNKVKNSLVCYLLEKRILGESVLIKDLDKEILSTLNPEHILREKIEILQVEIMSDYLNKYRYPFKRGANRDRWLIRKLKETRNKEIRLLQKDFFE